MDKKAKTILIAVVTLVIIVALFMPYVEKEPEPIKLNTFSCSDVSENQENDTKLNKVSCSQYQDLIKSEEKSIVLIARPSCGYCTKFIPILEEVVEEYGIVINYFDTDALSKEEVSSFYTSSTLFENNFGTPTLLIIKDNHIINYKGGYMDKNATVKWLKKVKLINE